MSYTDPFRDMKTKKLVLQSKGADCNLNNMDLFSDVQRNKEIPVPVLAQLIVLALDMFNNPKGTTLKEIRKCLFVSGLIEPTESLRRAMVWALKKGFVARPRWAVKSGQYGFYVKGDGIPIFAGSKVKKGGKRKAVAASAPSRHRKTKRSDGGRGSGVKGSKGSGSGSAKRRQKGRKVQMRYYH